jgi:hypothetical protein
LKKLAALPGDQIGIARPRADEIDFALLPHGRGSVA